MNSFGTTDIETIIVLYRFIGYFTMSLLISFVALFIVKKKLYDKYKLILLFLCIYLITMLLLIGLLD